LLKIGFNKGKKAHDVRIPQIIVSDSEFMKYTVRGIFDTDGCLFFDKRKGYKSYYPRITIQVTSEELIDQLKEYLSKSFSLYINKTNRDCCRNTLEIYGHEQLERFLKDIGFSNKRHLDKIQMPL
jgi:intein/homing endonuclease